MKLINFLFQLRQSIMEALIVSHFSLESNRKTVHFGPQFVYRGLLLLNFPLQSIDMFFFHLQFRPNPG